MDKKFKIVVSVLLVMNAIFLGIILFRPAENIPGPDLSKIENEIRNIYQEVDTMAIAVNNNNALIDKIGVNVNSVNNFLAHINQQKKKIEIEFISDIEDLKGLSNDSLKAIALIK